MLEKVLDENFVKIQTAEDDTTDWYDLTPDRFEFYGVIEPEEDGILSRRLPHAVAQTLNESVMIQSTFGAGGRAKGEQSMADFLADLPMCLFVSDYDFNAPDAEHLEKTHYRLYETIRAKRPDIPYIMISHPVTFPRTAEPCPLAYPATGSARARNPQ